MSWIATGVFEAMPSAREKQWGPPRITRFDEIVAFSTRFPVREWPTGRLAVRL